MREKNYYWEEEGIVFVVEEKKIKKKNHKNEVFESEENVLFIEFVEILCVIQFDAV